MPSKRGRPKGTQEGSQIAFRLKKELADRLEHAAEALGLDVSNLLRLMLSEKLAEYEARARRVQEHQAEAEGVGDGSTGAIDEAHDHPRARPAAQAHPARSEESPPARKRMGGQGPGTFLAPPSP
jgi:hypothetical protein